MVMFGALTTLDMAWSLADITMGTMAIFNLVAIILLGKYAFRLLENYRKQKKEGIKSPVFHKSLMPDIADEIECWDD